MDLFRKLSRGQYYNDFSFLNYGESFPNKEIIGRNSVYKWRHKQYTGEYGHNKNLIAHINGIESEIPYKLITINYFKLLTNKMTDLVMNNDITIKSGSIENDKQIMKLIERTDWKDSIRKAFKLCTEYGDSCLKTHKHGVSAFSPFNCFKVVDRSDITKTLAYVLYEPLYEDVAGVKNLRYIRFEIHTKGKIFEIVKDYIGTWCGSGTVGRNVSVKYKNRVIPAQGTWYDTGIIDCELVQWLSINQEADGVYGESIYTDIQDIVFAIEQRISVNQHLLDNSMTPFIVVGADMVDTVVDANGREHRELKLLHGKYMISQGLDSNIKSVELNYNLENSEHMISTLQGYLYELSEMGRTYLSGEYSGNISEETLSNTIKSAIDKGNRLITEMYSSFRDSLYCLCRLNDIEVQKSDITIVFNIGRTDDDMKVAEICKLLVENGILSRATIREKYYGFNKDQSDAEDKQIQIENSTTCSTDKNDNIQDIENDFNTNMNMKNEIGGEGIENNEIGTNVPP